MEERGVETARRMAALRDVMRRESMAAYIFPTGDPHCGEFVPDHWKGREYISGFNGSAGTAVVTMTAAALWTDSRYFLAAEEQLEGTPFVLMRQGVDGTPSVAQWTGRQLARSAVTDVGIDGMTATAAAVAALRNQLREQGGLTLRTNSDPLDVIWADRPPLPKGRVVVHPMAYAGESAVSKLARIRAALKERNADGTLVSALDDIAWTLNLRGEDVHCNPVFVAFLLVTRESATLFVDRAKLTDGAVRQLAECRVAIDDYGAVARALRAYDSYSILIDSAGTCHTLYNMVRCPKVIDAPSPVTAMKAVKNDVEISGFRAAMTRDGVAMVSMLCTLREDVARGGLTELAVSRRLEELRAAQPLYRGPSFDTIAAYEAHGAIVHYEPTTASDSTLRPEGLLLIDSGAHYDDGTTDITRTVALGHVTDEQRRAYTLVLKAHIALARLVFPRGAAGTQIDAIARSVLWREGMNYLHGTGHGVGSCLNVHEGPQQIRMEWVGAPLLPGMTVTDEPGLYVPGRFGVRTENTMLVVPHAETPFGSFVAFEPLTLCPIDTAPLITGMLTNDERDWLNDYHRTVCDRLAPALDTPEKDWLRDATAPL